MTKIKKHIIEVETDYEYEMIGICSHHSDYRIVWEINDKLELQFFKKPDLFKVWNFFDYSVKSNCLFFCDAKIPNIIFKSSWLNISELICEMASEKSRSIPIVSKLFKRLSQEK